jgi:hypothetical protein
MFCPVSPCFASPCRYVLPITENFLPGTFTKITAESMQTALYRPLPVQFPDLHILYAVFGNGPYLPAIPYTEIPHGIPEKEHGTPVEKMPYRIIRLV